MGNASVEVSHYTEQEMAVVKFSPWQISNKHLAFKQVCRMVRLILDLWLNCIHQLKNDKGGKMYVKIFLSREGISDKAVYNVFANSRIAC